MYFTRKNRSLRSSYLPWYFTNVPHVTKMGFPDPKFVRVVDDEGEDLLETRAIREGLNKEAAIAHYMKRMELGYVEEGQDGDKMARYFVANH